MQNRNPTSPQPLLSPGVESYSGSQEPYTSINTSIRHPNAKHFCTQDAQPSHLFSPTQKPLSSKTNKLLSSNAFTATSRPTDTSIQMPLSDQTNIKSKMQTLRPTLHMQKRRDESPLQSSQISGNENFQNVFQTDITGKLQQKFKEKTVKYEWSRHDAATQIATNNKKTQVPSDSMFIQDESSIISQKKQVRNKERPHLNLTTNLRSLQDKIFDLQSKLKFVEDKLPSSSQSTIMLFNLPTKSLVNEIHPDQFVGAKVKNRKQYDSSVIDGELEICSFGHQLTASSRSLSSQVLVEKRVVSSPKRANQRNQYQLQSPSISVPCTTKSASKSKSVSKIAKKKKFVKPATVCAETQTAKPRSCKRDLNSENIVPQPPTISEMLTRRSRRIKAKPVTPLIESDPSSFQLTQREISSNDLKYQSLKEDFKKLFQQFEQSELIRKDQSLMIENLKQQIECQSRQIKQIQAEGPAETLQPKMTTLESQRPRSKKHSKKTR